MKYYFIKASKDGKVISNVVKTNNITHLIKTMRNYRWEIEKNVKINYATYERHM